MNDGKNVEKDINDLLMKHLGKRDGAARLDRRLYHYKKINRVKKIGSNIKWLQILLVTVHILFFLFFLVRSPGLDTDDKVISIAAYAIFVAITMPFLQHIMSGNSKTKTDKIEFLLFFISELIIEQSHSNNDDERQRYIEVLNKINALEQLDIYNDDEFEAFKYEDKMSRKMNQD